MRMIPSSRDPKGHLQTGHDAGSFGGSPTRIVSDVIDSRTLSLAIRRFSLFMPLSGCSRAELLSLSRPCVSLCQITLRFRQNPDTLDEQMGLPAKALRGP